jgi:hypothetical protein
MTGWYLLGFTADAVAGAQQHVRMAEACFNAWRAAGRPTGFRICETSGEGEYILHWFVSAVAAAVLDAQRVPWRDFVIGQRDTPAPEGRDLVNWDQVATE